MAGYRDGHLAIDVPDAAWKRELERLEPDLLERLRRCAQGLRFEALTCTPANPGDQKFNGVSVNGIKLAATDRARYSPVTTAMHILVEVRKLHGDSLRFSVAHFDRLIGSPRVREQIVAGASVADITKDWDAEVAAFNRTRVAYLLYR